MLITDYRQIQEGDVLRAFIDPEAIDFEGVYALGIVDEPAIHQHLILQDKNSKIKTTDYIKVIQSSEDKNIIYTPVLIPNQMITKYTPEGVKFSIYYEAGDIRKCAENFLQKFSQKNITINHEQIASEVAVVETWVVDKKVKPLPKVEQWNEVVENTWIVGMRINNVEILNKVKDGILKGASIEGLFLLEKVENKDIKNRVSKSPLDEFFEYIEQNTY